MQVMKHLVVASMLIMVVHAMHFQHNEASPELAALREQQAQFEGTINKLVDNISRIESEVQNTNNVSEKVLILENAIFSERQDIFRLQNQIVPPFNLSRTACKEMTDAQKIHILDQLQKAKKQVDKLRNISETIPPCDQVDMIKRDIQKESFLIESIEMIVYTKCNDSLILSPTVFQTNLNSDWILGPQTIDDVIQEYYQRSIQYHNVTNCPSSHPFFNGAACINCTKSQPLFNIYTRQCTSCSVDSRYDSKKKICLILPKCTNYSNANNYVQDAPQQDCPSASQPCQNKSTPYSNSDSTKCIACEKLNYYSIKQKTCKKCPEGEGFKKSQKKCAPIEQGKLSVLQNTSWVTNDGNITRVLEERAEALELNKTSGNLSYCSKDEPFFDGNFCISCPQQFNLDDQQCSTPTNSTVYSPNSHSYVQPQQKDSNPTAENYVGQKPEDTTLDDCNQSYPFNDGISCIRCQQPFKYFQIQTKKCIECDGGFTFNQTSHECQPDNTIYISQNKQNLMATPNMSIQDYEEEQLTRINQNPQALVIPCPNGTYSNFTACFPCDQNLYFNVETKECMQCNGIYNQTNNLCHSHQVYSNLNASGYYNLADKAAEQAKIDEKINEDPESKVCPIQKPFVSNGQCIKCSQNQAFNYSNKKCIDCDQNTILSNGAKCITRERLNNFQNSTIPRYIQVDNYTVTNVSAQQQKTKVQNPDAEECPATYPFVINDSCVNCTEPTAYYNLKTKLCSIRQACPPATPMFNATIGKCVECPKGSNFSNATQTCQENKYSNLSGNWTSSNPEGIIKQTNALKKNPSYSQCKQQSPYFNNISKVCTQCPNETVYDYDTNQCKSCSPLSYDQNLHSCIPKAPQNTYQTSLSRPNLVYGGISKAEHQDNYNANKVAHPSIEDCPVDKPYYDGINCIKCPSYIPLFNLRYKKCTSCDNYDSSKHECINQSGQPIVDKPNVEKMYSSIF